MNYEEDIKKRRKENLEVMQSLGILSLRQEHHAIKKPSQIKKPKNTLRKNPTRQCLSMQCPSRRSKRLLGQEPKKFFQEEIEEEEDIHETKPTKLPIEKIKRENVFGAIPGVAVGTEFATRIEASHAGIHRPTVAGIHGNPALGCYSLALSGGYEDDVDLGDSFIYTGEGGRDLKGTKTNPKNLRTAPQSKDQILERGNLALSKNVENNLPVRVLRGYKLKSKFAPLEGYRYDGLYNVVDYYLTQGLSGFQVYKFRMERIKDQEPAPWVEDFAMKENLDNAEFLPEEISES
ncbi:e3 ubiquitin-protein ligase UHRF1 [Trichonephila inaurata madagascariensis]|uniref:E3 ubiquitin-protein ligase UHRF1 n=1 Tax=Trichonephila inaurata madagascariensis TaxID=2747483 RepID=A0A8X6XWG8_9ARAC|nr:e3 ubiquitin-protein ligase UHRF1 [Trichonephila inaurata madagascariensis]